MGYPYQSWAPARYLAIHWARVDSYRFGFENSRRVARLEVFLEVYDKPHAVVFGFSIEKPNKEIPKPWDWVRFIDKLENDSGYVKNLRKIMKEHKLEIKAWKIPENDSVKNGDRDCFCRKADFNIQEVVRKLKAIKETSWCDLMICRTIPKQKAIRMEAKIENEIITVLLALVPIYEKVRRNQEQGKI